MVKEELKGFLVSTERQVGEVVVVPYDFEKFYELMNCRCVEYAYRSLAGKEYAFVCDEEGLMVNEPRITAVNTSYQSVFVGSFLIFNTGGVDGLDNLTDEDVDIIKGHLKKMPTQLHPEGLLMLVGIESEE